MDQDQLVFLVLHGIIAYGSTMIKEQEQEQDQGGCRQIIILVINSLSLVIISQYLRDFYYALALAASVYVQYISTPDEKQRMTYIAILVAIFILTGGLSLFKLCGEGFTNYTTVNNQPIFTRSQLIPSRILPRNPFNLGQSGMTGDNQVVRPQDPHFRQIHYNDFDTYEDDEGTLQCDLSIREKLVVDRITQVYENFRPIYKLIVQDLWDNNIDGTMELLQRMIIQEMTMEQQQAARDLIVNRPINQTQQNSWYNQMQLHSSLWVFLNMVVKPVVPQQVYLASIPLLKRQDWNTQIAATSSIIKIIQQAKQGPIGIQFPSIPVEQFTPSRTQYSARHALQNDRGNQLKTFERNRDYDMQGLQQRMQNSYQL